MIIREQPRRRPIAVQVIRIGEPGKIGPVDIDAVRAAMATCAPGERADVAPSHERKSVRRRVWHALTQPASRQGGIRKWT